VTFSSHPQQSLGSLLLTVAASSWRISLSNFCIKNMFVLLLKSVILDSVNSLSYFSLHSEPYGKSIYWTLPLPMSQATIIDNTILYMEIKL
jgi:hypothetical protein